MSRLAVFVNASVIIPSFCCGVHAALGKSFRVRSSMPCMPPNLQTLGASSGLIRSPREDPFRYPLVILDSY